MVFDAQSMVFETNPVLSLRTWPSGARYWFDHADYDEATDRLHLTCGPSRATRACPTPEGHIVRVADHDGCLCGVTITDLQRRLDRRGRIDFTLPDLERVSLTLEDVAEALTA
jgi:hypothetical protein